MSGMKKILIALAFLLPLLSFSQETTTFKLITDTLEGNRAEQVVANDNFVLGDTTYDKAVVIFPTDSSLSYVYVWYPYDSTLRLVDIQEIIDTTQISGYWTRSNGLYPTTITDSVGINTSTPGEHLDVDGNAHIDSLAIGGYSSVATYVFRMLGDYYQRTTENPMATWDMNDALPALHKISRYAGSVPSGGYQWCYGMSGRDYVWLANCSDTVLRLSSDGTVWVDTLRRFSEDGLPQVLTDGMRSIDTTYFNDAIYWEKPDTNNSATYLTSWNPSDSSMQVSRVSSVLSGVSTYWELDGDTLSPTNQSYNVGIGTGNATEKLTIDGNFELGETTATKGSIKQGGTKVFHTYDTDGSKNIFIGADAGNTTLDSTANIAIGYNAGDDLAGGYENVIIGTNAGGSLTDGYQNVFIGDSAGSSLISGHSNTLAGWYSGYSTTGSGNSFYGKGSGLSNTSSWNDAFGYGAFENNTSGYYNSVFGGGALNLNTTGIANSVFGVNAGGQVLGDSNIIIGYQSAYTQTDISGELWIDNDNNDPPFIWGDMYNDHKKGL